MNEHTPGEPPVQPLPEASLASPIHAAPPPTPEGDTDPGAQRPFPLLAAPLAMLFTPGRFFRYAAPRCPMVLIFLLAYMGGLMRYDSRMQLRYSPSHPTFGNFFKDWSVYWGIGAIGALLTAGLVIAMGGWFYRVRMRWSGVPNADVRLTNIIFISCDTFTYSAGFIALTVATLLYDTPAEYYYTTRIHWWDFMPMLFLLWSPVMSYRALREIFGINQVSGLIWFLVLPILLRLVAFGLIVIGLALIGSSVFSEPPTVDSPVVYNDSVFGFEYPSNWTAQEDPQEWSVTVSPPQDASLVFSLFQSDLSEESEIRATVGRLQDSGFELTYQGGFSSYAGLGGQGHTYSDTEYSLIFDYQIRVFVTTINDGEWMLEVMHFETTEDQSTLAPGFQLIEDSFSITPPDP